MSASDKMHVPESGTHSEGDLYEKRVRRGRRKWLFRLGALFVSSIVAILLLEGSVRGLVYLGKLPRYVSQRNGGFWNAEHPLFGVWHQPKSSALQSSECFSTTYETNSVGARDVERSQACDAPRVFVTGDSFVEGWGLHPEERFSNQLEQQTGVAHLNFGMSHFSPYQQYLVYKHFGPQFEHSAVLVGILPVNDFVDIDITQAKRARSYDYRYRPYLVPDANEYRHVDYRESSVGKFLRVHSHAYHAISSTVAKLSDPEGDDVYAPPVTNAQGLPHSYFYDYSERQFDLLRHCLDLIVTQADGRPFAVVLLPAQWDFVRFEKQPVETPLALRLVDWAKTHHVVVVDLLPPMANANANWQRYFFDCDYHWSAEGNRVAAQVLQQQQLGPFFYEKPEE